jgi:hypothetical protein
MGKLSNLFIYQYEHFYCYLIAIANLKTLNIFIDIFILQNQRHK